MSDAHLQESVSVPDDGERLGTCSACGGYSKVIGLLHADGVGRDTCRACAPDEWESDLVKIREILREHMECQPDDARSALQLVCDLVRDEVERRERMEP